MLISVIVNKVGVPKKKKKQKQKQRKLEAGSGMKSSSRDRDTQFFTVGMRDVFEIDGGKEDHKNNFMTEKTPNNLIMIIYMKGIITCVFRFTGDIQSLRPCPRPPHASP